jgi:hypothetical protein
VAPGTRFSGTFSYDPSEAPTSLITIEGSVQTIYGKGPGFPNGVPDSSGLSLQVGGQSVYSYQGGLQVSVAEIDGKYGYTDGHGNPAAPNMDVNISNGNVDNGPLTVALDLKNPSQAPLDSLHPPTYLSLADFPQAQLNVTELTNPGTTTLYTGTIDTLTAVPEPTTAVLFGVAAVGWLAHARRRRRAAGQ